MSDYPEEPTQTHPPSTQNSTLAIISLIAGILGWTAVPLLGSIAAVITGHMAKKEIQESRGSLSGDGLATAGLVLGYSALGLGLLAICGFVCFLLFTVVTSANTEFSLIPLLFTAL